MADVLEYKIPSLADNNRDLGSSLVEFYNQLDLNDKKDLLMKSASKTLKKQAIECFINSNNFYQAYEVGTKILLPYAEFYDSDDVKSILDGTLANNKKQTGIYKANQILNASSIDEVFKKLFDITQLHSFEIWEEFIKNTEQEFNYFYLEMSKHIDEYHIPFRVYNTSGDKSY